MPYTIAEALGAKWFGRDGVKAIERLGTLPQADDLDRALFEGMCKSAKTADEHLALLTWYVGPGRRLERFEKGYHPLLERLLTRSAELDLEKTRAWVELHFPPKTTRKSNNDEDWDIGRCSLPGQGTNRLELSNGSLPSIAPMILMPTGST